MGHDQTKSKGHGSSTHNILNRIGNVVHDPYIPKEGFPEPAMCPVCNATYHKKHWSFDANQRLDVLKDKATQKHICPACKKIQDKYAMGKVFLSGSFVNEHVDELISIINSEERHAKEKNPLDRLMSVEKKNNGIYVETTSDALAMRIGHHLKNAYKGSDEEFKFRAGDKFVEIDWHRD
jgi:hypothetical protein